MKHTMILVSLLRVWPEDQMDQFAALCRAAYALITPRQWRRHAFKNAIKTLRAQKIIRDMTPEREHFFWADGFERLCLLGISRHMRPCMYEKQDVHYLRNNFNAYANRSGQNGYASDMAFALYMVASGFKVKYMQSRGQIVILAKNIYFGSDGELLPDSQTNDRRRRWDIER